MRRKTRLRLSSELRLPFFVLGVFFLVLWVMLIVKVDPVIVADVLIPNYYLPFFMLFWLWSGLIIYAVFLSVIRAVIWSTALTLFTFLRLNELGHILNALLILSIVMTVEFIRRHNKVVD